MIKKYWAVLIVAFIGLTSVTLAATYKMSGGDPNNSATVSWENIGTWVDIDTLVPATTPPTNGNDYVVGVEFLRTPYPAGGSYVFGGDSLTITNGGGIILKCGGASTLTVNDLILLDGGYIRSGLGSGDTTTFNGNMTVLGTGGEVRSDQNSYIINSYITGSGDLSLSGGYEITLHGTNALTGDILVTTGTKTFASDSVSIFTIGANGVNSAITGTGAVFDGTFVFDLTGASTTVGDSWTLTTSGAAFNSNFSVDGFFDNGDGSWYLDNGSAKYKFYQDTGVLHVVNANVVPIFIQNQTPLGAGAHPQPEISVDLLDGDPDTVETVSITLTVNGDLKNHSLSTSGITNTVSFTPATPFAAGSTNDVEVTFYGSTASSPTTSSWSFVVVPYSALSTNGAIALSATNSGQRGFSYRDRSFDIYPAAFPHIDSLAQAEDALRYWGDFGNPSNDVTTATETSDGFAYFNDVINYGDNTTRGEFNVANGFADITFPGILNGPGAPDVAVEIGGYLELDAGIQIIGLNDVRYGAAELFLGDLPFDVFATNWKQSTMAASDGGFEELEGAVNVTQAGLYPFKIVFHRYKNYANDDAYGYAIELYTKEANGNKILVNDTANGGIRAWRSVTEPGGYIAAIQPGPDAYIAPSQDVTVDFGGIDVDEAAIELSVNGTPLINGYDYLVEVDPIDFYPTGVTLVRDVIMVPNQLNDFELIYAVSGGDPITNSWSYDVANYVEFLEGTPTGTLFTNETPVEAKLISLAGTLNTSSLVMKFDGAPVSPAINTGLTNTVTYTTSGLSGTQHTAELIWEANEGGGLNTNSWSFSVHPTTLNTVWSINIAGATNTVLENVTDGAIAKAPSAGLNLWNNISGTTSMTNNFSITDANGANAIGFQTSGAHLWGTKTGVGSPNTPLIPLEMFRGWTGANLPMNMTSVISGLDTANSYDIYLYSSWGWTENAVNYNLIEGYADTSSGSIAEIRANVLDVAADDYTHLVYGDNYIVFTNVTPTVAGRIAFTGQSSDGVMSGLQILERPGEGALPAVSYVSVAPQGTVSVDAVNLEVVMVDVGVTVNIGDVELLLDGSSVAPDSIGKNGETTTVSYAVSDLDLGAHTAAVVPVIGGGTNEWNFIVTPLSGTIVYVDAAPANTDAWNTNSMTFASYNPPVDGVYGNDNEWEIEIFANNATWYEAQRDGPEENAPQLKTRVTGLADSTYAVYAFGWTADLSAGWRLAASLTPSYTNGLTIYNTGSSGVYYPAQSEFAAPQPIITEANRQMFAVYLGTVTGTSISVYIDDADGNTAAADQGFWYDGIGYVDLNPAVAGPVVGATVTGGSLIMTWEGGASFNVETNSDLTDPGGWSPMTGGMSPITNAVGAEANLFYRLSN